MKRLFIFTAILCLITGLAACGSGDIMEPVEFCYQQIAAPDTLPDTVFAYETREAAGHRNDMNYLLSLYLQGPLESDLKSPFPSGCRLLHISRENDTLIVTLDQTVTSLGQLEQTLACACLAQTCFSLTDVDTVQIIAEAEDPADSLNVTIHTESFLLEDLPATQPTEEPQ